MSTDLTNLGTSDVEPESCEECASFRVGRRGFLGGAAGLTALGLTGGFSALGNMQVAFADADSDYNNNTLVVVSIRGGFDGLSAVMPMGDPYYLGANSIRPTVGLQAGANPFQLGSSIFSMHPAMASLQGLWNAGSLAFVHDVGQEDPTMSHFDAEALMEQAAPGRPNSSGWIQRAATQTGAPSTAFAEVSLGPSQAPASTYGSYPVTAMQSLSSFKLQGLDTYNNATLPVWTTALNAMQAGGSTYVSTPAKNASTALAQVSSLPAAGSGYPGNTDLANSLKDLARLIKAGGVRLAAVDSNGTSYRGWDMHVGMGTGGDQNGWIWSNLQTLSQSLSAFMADLGPAASNVTVVTMSEFGRRAYENDSQGLDHGHGNLMMVMGGGINGGQVLGNWRGLQPYSRSNPSASGLDVNGNLPGTNDYRTVIAEILSKRLDFRTTDIQTVFPNSGAINPMANWLTIASQA